MKMEIPSPVLHSLFALNQAGYEAYIVGGCVRDSLMGKEPFDWDITTSALPKETLAVFQNYRTIETGIQHGTVTVIIEDMPLEITTFRVDGDYSDGRHPDNVSFTCNIKEDLRRRDFTVNAMAYHPRNGLVDPFHGQKDLKKQLIRCVGNPKKRFTEDALRILRGLRFAATLGFSISPSTARSIRKLADSLSLVSAERISVELLKLICGKSAGKILFDYADTLSIILPDVEFAKMAKVVSSVPNEPTSRLTALLLNRTPKEAENACKRLKLSARMTKDVTTLIRYKDIPLKPTRSSILQALNKLGPELLFTLIPIKSVIEQQSFDEFQSIWNILESDGDLCYRTKDLAITGDDLITAGIPAGPELGTTLNALLNAVMDGTCPNEKESLLNRATKKPVQ